MSSKPQHNYLPQLDGIRTIAIGLVLIFHWLPTNHWVNTLPNGTIGVTLFFVLSGFLITDILIKNKTESLGDAVQVYKVFDILAGPSLHNVGQYKITLHCIYKYGYAYTIFKVCI